MFEAHSNTKDEGHCLADEAHSNTKDEGHHLEGEFPGDGDLERRVVGVRYSEIVEVAGEFAPTAQRPGSL